MALHIQNCGTSFIFSFNPLRHEHLLSVKNKLNPQQKHLKKKKTDKHHCYTSNSTSKISGSKI